jgi:RimJ/RimL family protein N-acetyltransferase
MNAALQKAKIKGLTRIELTVREKNTPAIALYEQMGFEKEGIHKNGVCIDGKYESHILSIIYVIYLKPLYEL